MVSGICLGSGITGMTATCSAPMVETRLDRCKIPKAPAVAQVRGSCAEIVLTPINTTAKGPCAEFLH